MDFLGDLETPCANLGCPASAKVETAQLSTRLPGMREQGRETVAAKRTLRRQKSSAAACRRSWEAHAVITGPRWKEVVR